MILINDVTKKFDRFSIKNISLQIPDGYITGLIGLNGAGKTTLFHLILGLYAPTQGEILVDGMDYEHHERAIREKIGVVLQERLFEEYETLEGNARMYGRYFTAYQDNRFHELLEEFGLDARQKYKTLSKGEELKFQFAFALAHNPKLLLLDEPTGNFDPEFRNIFWKKLQDFIADGAHSVILATHLTDDLDRMADYIIYMEGGEILLSNDIESLRREYRIIQGEGYKVRLFPKEYVIAMEEGEFGAKALVRHKNRFEYNNLAVASPTIEELMYFMTKRGTGKRK